MSALQDMVTQAPKGEVLDIGTETYILDAPLYVNDKGITGSGATIVMPDGIDGPAVRCRKTVALTGAVTVAGTKDPLSRYTPPREFQHGIVAEGVLGLDVEWNVENVWGDGVYIGKGPALKDEEGRYRWSENVHVYGGHIVNTGRQGVSVVAARHTLLEALYLEDVGRSVVDLEPPGHDWGVVDFTWRNSVAQGGHGVLLANKGGNAECDGITVEDIWAEDRAVDCRIVSLGRRRANYRIARLHTNVEVHHPPITLWGVDGVELELSGMEIPISGGQELYRPNDCTGVVIS